MRNDIQGILSFHHDIIRVEEFDNRWAAIFDKRMVVGIAWRPVEMNDANDIIASGRARVTVTGNDQRSLLSLVVDMESLIGLVMLVYTLSRLQALDLIRFRH